MEDERVGTIFQFIDVHWFLFCLFNEQEEWNFAMISLAFSINFLFNIRTVILNRVLQNPWVTEDSLGVDVLIQI